MERYSRQEILKEIGKKRQGMLEKASVAIIGIGAIGSVTASLLARAGIGKIVLIDRDIVEEHNVQRQMLFTEEDRVKPKAAQAMAYLQKVNKTIHIEADTRELNAETIHTLKNYDLMLDCTDNMETRFLINDFCTKYRKQWIHASAIATKARCVVITPETPCFRCIFKPAKPGSLETCDTTGVLNTITTAIASIQCTEAIKVLTEQQYIKELLLYDIWKQDLTTIRTKKKKDCLCCAKKEFTFLAAKASSEATKLCGQGRVQVRGSTPNITALLKRLEKCGRVKQTKYGLVFEANETNFFLFTDGRCLIKARTTEEAKSLYSKYIGY